MRAVQAWLFVALVLAGACKGFAPESTDAGTFAPCCGDRGSCIPSLLVPIGIAARLPSDGCGDSLVCAPTSLLEGPPACRLAGGIEGRCLPDCLPDVAGQADKLQRRECVEGSLCLPCYDPLTGEDNGVCRVGRDKPADPARTFGACCGSGEDALGRCVPRELLVSSAPDLDLEHVAADSCREADSLCVPEVWLDARSTPQVCRAAGDIEGRCLPDCLPDVAAKADQLEQRTCSKGHSCLPCFNPLDGQETGICKIGSDQPRTAARRFGECCRRDGVALGRCVPKPVLLASASDDDLTHLAADSCSAAGELCVPEGWLDATGMRAQTCHATGNLEGRCLPNCLPEVAEQADKLEQRDCPASNLCLPCANPFTGEPTGVCSIGDDKPAEPLAHFASCCGDEHAPLGHCVPRAILSQSLEPSELARLGLDRCSESNSLCVPDALIDLSKTGPAVCHAAGGFEGRCLPDCLPDVAAQAERLQQRTCDRGELCLPCYNPIDGQETGICRLGDDAPREPVHKFPSCCGGDAAALGRCVPQDVLLQEASDSDVAHLGRDRCGERNELCVPAAWLDPSQPAAAICHIGGNFEGRCLPSCLPDVAAQADALQQASCAQGELCLPCYNPFDGADTGICRLGNDTPREPVRQFEPCCGSGDEALGRCVPKALLEDQVGAQDLARLGPDRCRGSDTLCVPEIWLDPTQPASPSCHAAGGLEGRCLPSCLPDLAARGAALRATCGDNLACLPCYNPVDGSDTGVCRLGADQPREPALRYPSCCGTGSAAKGVCVPAELLGSDQQATLLQETCPAVDQRCAPPQLMAADASSLPACAVDTLSTSEPGVCLDVCFMGSAAALLPRGSCALGERCIVCSSLPAGSDCP